MDTPLNPNASFTFEESQHAAAEIPDSSNDLNDLSSPTENDKVVASKDEAVDHTPASTSPLEEEGKKRCCNLTSILCVILDLINTCISTIFYLIHDNLEFCTTIATLICMSVSCGSDNIISVVNVLCLWFLTPSLNPTIPPIYISVVNFIVVVFMFVMLAWTGRNSILSSLSCYGLEAINVPSWMGPTASHYLFISDVTSMYLLPNLLNMFFCVLLHQIRKEVYGYNKIGNDYINKSERTPWESLCSFIFMNITLIIQIFIFLVSANLPNVLTAVYFIFSLYYIVHPEKIRQIDNKPLFYLRVYALIHLIIIVLYQLPIIPDMYNIGDFPIMSFLGLHKLVMSPYENNPQCLDMRFFNTLREDTYCSNPVELDGILFLSLITALLQVLVCILYILVIHLGSHSEASHLQVRLEALWTWEAEWVYESGYLVVLCGGILCQAS